MFLNILIWFGLFSLAVYVNDRYNPKFDLVKSGKKYELFFWYNKYDWPGEYTRAYIKLF